MFNLFIYIHIYPKSLKKILRQNGAVCGKISRNHLILNQCHIKVGWKLSRLEDRCWGQKALGFRGLSLQVAIRKLSEKDEKEKSSLE